MGHIDWVDIGTMPDEQRDGRYVLLWDGVKPVIACWDLFSDGYDWATDEGRRVVPLEFAALNKPGMSDPIRA